VVAQDVGPKFKPQYHKKKKKKDLKGQLLCDLFKDKNKLQESAGFLRPKNA
jgi:hypothetical protein